MPGPRNGFSVRKRLTSRCNISDRASVRGKVQANTLPFKSGEKTVFRREKKGRRITGGREGERAPRNGRGEDTRLLLKN